MTSITAEILDTAIAQTLEQGGWPLTYFENSDVLLLSIGLPVALFVATQCIAAMMTRKMTIGFLRFVGVICLGAALAHFWIGFFRPMNDDAIAAPVKVVLEADTYLFGASYPSEPTIAQFLNARNRVSNAMQEAKFVARRLSLANVDLCQDDKLSLATMQLMLAAR